MIYNSFCTCTEGFLNYKMNCKKNQTVLYPRQTIVTCVDKRAKFREYHGVLLDFSATIVFQTQKIKISRNGFKKFAQTTIWFQLFFTNTTSSEPLSCFCYKQKNCCSKLPLFLVSKNYALNLDSDRSIKNFMLESSTMLDSRNYKRCI